MQKKIIASSLQAPCLARRGFLRRLAISISGTAMLAPWERPIASLNKRSLSFYHTHTNETLCVTYHAEGQLVPESLQRINTLLRDFRTDEVHEVDPRLLDFLYLVSISTDHDGVYEVISGYRSPKTNAMLRHKSKSVAKRSLHMQGRAIDVRLRGVDTSAVRKAAIALKKGGVGYYPRSNFVHLDTGRFRTW